MAELYRIVDVAVDKALMRRKPRSVPSSLEDLRKNLHTLIGGHDPQERISALRQTMESIEDGDAERGSIIAVVLDVFNSVDEASLPLDAQKFVELVKGGVDAGIAMSVWNAYGMVGLSTLQGDLAATDSLTESLRMLALGIRRDSKLNGVDGG